MCANGAGIQGSVNGANWLMDVISNESNIRCAICSGFGHNDMNCPTKHKILSQVGKTKYMTAAINQAANEVNEAFHTVFGIGTQYYNPTFGV
jgi:hypothetical protein